MKPKAYVVHRTPNRIRIRVPARKKDQDFFQKCLQEVLMLETKYKIEINFVLGTLLFIGAEDPMEVVYTLEKLGHFEVTAQPEKNTRAAVPLSQQIHQTINLADQTLKESSNGTLSFYSASALALFGLGVFQLARGTAIGSTTSL